MNTETKILLTINLEGGTLLKGESEVKKFYLTKEDLFPNQKFKGDAGKKIVRSGKYVSTTYISSVAKQKINICREAYDYMTSPDEIPTWFIPFKPRKERERTWRKMSESERLEQHLARTCLHFGGKSFSYQIVED